MSKVKEYADNLVKEFRRNNVDKPLMSVKQAKKEAIVSNEQVIVGLMEEVDFRRKAIKYLER